MLELTPSTLQKLERAKQMAALMISAYMAGNSSGQPTYDMNDPKLIIGMRADMNSELSGIALSSGLGDDLSLMISECFESSDQYRTAYGCITAFRTRPESGS